MAADIKVKYPSTSSVDLTISLASLASGSSGVFTAGQESTAVDNTSNLDLDHLLSGKITTGTSPTVSRSINVYAYANLSSSSGTPTYADVLDGTDSAETFTSANVMNSAVKFVASITIDNTSDRAYYFGPVSIASLFGGVLPKFWGVYVAHDTAVNLNSTAGNHKLSYERIQSQTV
jgi:hypothetical protein